MKRAALLLLLVGLVTPVLQGESTDRHAPQTHLLDPHLAYWIFSEPDEPQPEVPSAVEVTVSTDITVDGVTVYTEVSNFTVELSTPDPMSEPAAAAVSPYVETAVTNASVAVGATAGWMGGAAAGGAILAAVPVGASAATYAAAIGVAAVAPWVGLAAGAAGAAM
jgi:hypothetical protein